MVQLFEYVHNDVEPSKCYCIIAVCDNLFLFLFLISNRLTFDKSLYLLLSYSIALQYHQRYHSISSNNSLKKPRKGAANDVIRESGLHEHVVYIPIHARSHT